MCDFCFVFFSFIYPEESLEAVCPVNRSHPRYRSSGRQITLFLLLLPPNACLPPFVSQMKDAVKSLQARVDKKVDMEESKVGAKGPCFMITYLARKAQKMGK